MKKLLIFILGIVVGIVLVIGGVAGVGYYLATTEGGMGKIVDLVANTGVNTSNVPQTVRNQSVYEYAKNVIAVAADFSNKTIGDIESTMGINTFSNLLYKQFGIPASTTKASTLPNIGKTITDNLTLGTVSDKFGIGLPEFPLFENEAFLATPISTAFGDLDKYTLDSFVVVVYEEDATPENPASSILLQRMGEKKISEISNNVDAIIDDLLLSEIITDPVPGDVINEFLHLKVGDLKTHKFQETLDALPLNKIVTIDFDSPKVLRALKDCTLVTQYEEDGVTVKTQSLSDGLKYSPVSDLLELPQNSRVWNYLGTATLDTLGGRVENMTVADAIDIDDPACHILIKRLGTSKIKEIGVNLGPVVEASTLGEMVNIDVATAEPILVAVKDTRLKSSELNAAIAGLTIKNVFRNYNIGLLGLIDENTLLSQLPIVLSATLSGSTVYRLAAVGLYSLNTIGLSAEKKSFMYNQTPEQLMQHYIEIGKNAALALAMTPDVIVFSGSELTQAAVDALPGFKNGVTIKITGPVTIPDNEVFTSLFSIDAGDAGVFLTIGEGVTVDLGPWNAGYMFIKGYFTGTMTSPRIITRYPAGSAPAVLIDFLPA